VSIGMRSSVAALMIQQMTNALDLSAVSSRSAQDQMRLLEIGYQEAARSPEVERCVS
jgi:hypothetical protein